MSIETKILTFYKSHYDPTKVGGMNPINKIEGTNSIEEGIFYLFFTEQRHFRLVRVDKVETTGKGFIIKGAHCSGRYNTASKHLSRSEWEKPVTQKYINDSFKSYEEKYIITE